MKKDIRLMCITAVFIALTCIATLVIRIPIPLGYAQLGNSVIMLGTFLFGPFAGAIAGGTGSAMADLLGGFPIWMLPTFLIKSIFPLIMWGFIRKRKDSQKGQTAPLASIHTLLGVILSMGFMVIGYTLAGAILYGGLAAGLASAPGLIGEGIANGLAFYFLGFLCEKAHIKNLIQRKNPVKPKSVKTIKK